LFGILSAARLSEINEDNVAVVLLGPQHATFAATFTKNGRRDLVAETITGVLNRPTGVRFEVANGAHGAGDAAVIAQGSQAGERAAVAASGPAPAASPSSGRPTAEQLRELEKDPLVAVLMERFGAEVVRIED